MSECIIKDENKKKQHEARQDSRAEALKANLARRKQAAKANKAVDK